MAALLQKKVLHLVFENALSRSSYCNIQLILFINPVLRWAFETADHRTEVVLDIVFEHETRHLALGEFAIFSSAQHYAYVNPGAASTRFYPQCRQLN